MTIAELRMHCPSCQFPAKARWLDPEMEDVILPGRISAESIACSNPRCSRFSPEAFPSTSSTG